MNADIPFAPEFPYEIDEEEEESQEEEEELEQL